MMCVVLAIWKIVDVFTLCPFPTGAKCHSSEGFPLGPSVKPPSHSFHPYNPHTDCYNRTLQARALTNLTGGRDELLKDLPSDPFSLMEVERVLLSKQDN